MIALAGFHFHVHPRGLAQAGYLGNFESPHCIFRSGLGGGKSWCGGTKAAIRAKKNRGPGLLIGQNYTHLTQTMVPIIIERARALGGDPLWVVSKRIVLFRGWYRNNEHGCQFAYCRSGDAPEAITSINPTWGWFDECASYNRSDSDADMDGFFRSQQRVRGEDELAGIDYTGVNEGDGTRYYALQTSERDDVAVYTGSTIDNIEFVGEQYVRNLEEGLPPETHDQYLRGGVGSLAQEMAAWEWHKRFVDPTLRLDTAWPLVTNFDFGVSPMAMSYHQEPGNDASRFNWLGEVVMATRGNTADVTRTFAERMSPLHPGPVIVTGDPSGTAGSAQSKLENYEQIVAILSEYWPGQIVMQVLESAPSIMTRQIRANAAIRRSIVRVHPSCTNLLRDLGGCKRDPGTGKEVQKDKMSHSWVGMCYRLHQRCPIATPRKLARPGASGQMISHTRGTPTDPRSTVAGRIGR